MTLAALAIQFQQRHQEPRLLVLPNAWDACSALLMQGLGAEAIATTSAGVAWSLGYADGDELPIQQHVNTIQQITRVVTCPVSADAESGYSDDPREAAENVARLIDAGAVGVNLEDGSASVALLCRKIEAVKTVAARSGVKLFVNARTDVFLKGLAPGRELAEVLLRAQQYAAAGADGLFAPGVTAPADIAALVSGQALPLNVMARPALPPLAELSRLGVRRLSAGSAIAQKVWGLARLAGASFLAEGSTQAMFTEAATFSELNAMFAKA